MLAPGAILTDLVLEDSAGGPLPLPGSHGTATLLYLMRAVSCPLCNAHVRDLASREKDLDAAGVRVIVIVPEGQRRATKWKAAQRVPFAVAAGDGEGKGTHDELGFSRRLLGTMQQSGTVLIDAGGVVRHTRVSTMPTGAYDKNGLWAAIAALLPPQQARTRASVEAA